MRILFLTSYVDPSSGASVLVRLAERIRQQGHEVRILTTMSGFDSDTIRAVRSPVLVDVADRILNRVVPDYFSLKYRWILDQIRAFDPDVINVHWTHGPTVPIRIIPELSRTWPVFWTIHDLWPITAGTFFEYTGGENIFDRRKALLRNFRRSLKLRPRALLRYKARLLGAAGINTISPSKWIQEKVASSPVFSSAVNHHIPNGVDTAVFRPLDRLALRRLYGIADSARVILFLSANLADTRKGLFYFVEAMTRFNAFDPELASDVTVLLIGRNSSRANEYFPTQVRNLDTTKDVGRLVEYYNLADVFVSASLADNFPSTSLESLACGTPVVAFDVGGVSEIVRDGRTGLLGRSKDPDGMAANIRKILVDRELQRTLSQACRETAMEEFSMDRFANEYLNVFRAVYPVRSSQTGTETGIASGTRS